MAAKAFQDFYEPIKYTSASAADQNKAKNQPKMSTGGPYAFNLQTSFNPYSQVDSRDEDVIEVQRRTNQNADAAAGRDAGVSYNANKAIIADRMARINLKNQLGSSIANNAELERQAIEGIKSSAREGVDTGVKATRQNFNNRGLLYSGMREAGEGKVKAAGAAGLARDVAGAKSDYQNLLTQQQQAYANIGLQQQAQHLQTATEAFETATRNSVARAQAYQQLASGAGQAAGYYYGMRDTGSPQAQ
jgi:hypothetical protein